MFVSQALYNKAMLTHFAHESETVHQIKFQRRLWPSVIGTRKAKKRKHFSLYQQCHLAVVFMLFQKTIVKTSCTDINTCFEDNQKLP